MTLTIHTILEIKKDLVICQSLYSSEEKGRSLQELILQLWYKKKMMKLLVIHALLMLLIGVMKMTILLIGVIKMTIPTLKLGIFLLILLIKVLLLLLVI